MQMPSRELEQKQEGPSQAEGAWKLRAAGARPRLSRVTETPLTAVAELGMHTGNTSKATRVLGLYVHTG